ncbi:MAG: matrixin family metalloprotease [Phycisphaera sp.]|nr:matrixin family metalloprotease [Phycisphaera sp.]
MTKRRMFKTAGIAVSTATLSVALLGFSSQAQAYQLYLNGAGRWDSANTYSTADSGGTTQGNPINLTWSIMPDGTTLTQAYPSKGETNDPSNFVAFMDGLFGNGGGGALSARPWFHIMNDSYSRWGEVAGITMTYQAADDGATMSNSNGGSAARGDMRVGGHYIDGQSGSNTLAYNYFPQFGDMVVDTSNSNSFSLSTNDYRYIRDTLMHELGHGIGINHLDSNNSIQLMEPFINTNIDGPQHDDIRSAQRLYGDIYEKGNGNDTAANATALGVLAANSTLSKGKDGDNTVVARTDVDFISIDDDSDTDYLSFTVNTQLAVSLVLTPMGITYNEGPQGGTQTSVNTKNISDLTLALYDTNGTSQLALSNATGVGGSESILNYVLSAGTYFARVTGAANDLQFYQIDVSAGALIPEPASLGLIVIGLGALLKRSRKAHA